MHDLMTATGRRQYGCQVDSPRNARELPPDAPVRVVLFGGRAQDAFAELQPRLAAAGMPPQPDGADPAAAPGILLSMLHALPSLSP